MTVFASAIAALIALRILASAGWDPTAFAAFGEEATLTTDYAEAKLGREVVTRPGQGHDGRFFFVQANDPLLLDPDNNAEIVDRPLYRSQRMFYPLLVSGLGFFPPAVIIWLLPIANILALGLGTWAVAGIAIRHGAPAWVGLGFVLNVGLISELSIDGAGILAFGLACLGALALEDERPAWAAAAFTVAVLSREVMVLFVGSIAFFWLIRRKAVPWIVAIPPAVAALGWAAYVRFRVDSGSATDALPAFDITPFSGVVESLTSGRGTYVDYLAIGGFLALLVLIPYRAWRSDVYLTWGAFGLSVMGPFLTTFIWQKYFDISRALAPLITVFLLELLLVRARREKAVVALKSSGISNRA